jgi:hypothetical protein
MEAANLLGARCGNSGAIDSCYEEEFESLADKRLGKPRS